MSVSVTIRDRFPLYAAKSKAASLVATRQIAGDILRLAKMRAPYSTGTKDSGKHLVQTGKVIQLSANSLAVSFSDSLPYGRWWEFNDTHPRFGTPVTFKAGRQSKYLRSSVEDVAGDPESVQAYYVSAMQ